MASLVVFENSRLCDVCGRSLPVVGTLFFTQTDNDCHHTELAYSFAIYFHLVQIQTCILYSAQYRSGMFTIILCCKALTCKASWHIHTTLCCHFLWSHVPLSLTPPAIWLRSWVGVTVISVLRVTGTLASKVKDANMSKASRCSNFLSLSAGSINNVSLHLSLWCGPPVSHWLWEELQRSRVQVIRTQIL